MGPLDGIRVIDWTIFQQGPVATAMLGDLGAEVIKIEERGRGDPGRGFATISGVSSETFGERNFYFEANNRNKKSIALDLKKEKARQIVYRLVEKSDVFVHNFRQGVPERLGLGYEMLSQHNPALIYASASGYGPEGAESSRPSLDPAALARAAMLDATAPPGSPPFYPQGGLADQMGAIMLAYGVLAALIARQRLGVGQKIDASHLASMMWLQGLNVHAALILGHEMPKWRRDRVANPLYNYYQCADGRWLFICLLQSDRHWPSLCQALGIEELEKDARFENMHKRRENRVELTSILDKAFARRPSSEWVDILRHYPDLIYETVNTISDLVADPQVIANDYVVEVPHPALGSIKMVNVPVKFDKTPSGIRTVAPEFGQHTEEVLADICGYTWEEIAELRNEAVI